MTIETKQKIIQDFQKLYPNTHSVAKLRQHLRMAGWSEQAIKATIDLYIQTELRRTDNGFYD